MLNLLIRRMGQPVVGFGLGAVDPYLKPETDLQTQMQPAITLGDKYQAGLEEPPSTLLVLQKTPWAAAIDQYVKAGKIGTVIIGPAITAAGQPAATDPLVQQADAAGAQLAAIGDQWSVNASDATKAQALVRTMTNAYTMAISAGRQALGVAPSPGKQTPTPGPITPPSPPPPPPHTSWGILVPVSILVAAGGVYYFTRK